MQRELLLRQHVWGYAIAVLQEQVLQQLAQGSA